MADDQAPSRSENSSENGGAMNGADQRDADLRIPRGTDGGSAAEHGLGGDPACWLSRVCEGCGRFIDDEFAVRCPLCGWERDPGSGA